MPVVVQVSGGFFFVYMVGYNGVISILFSALEVASYVA